MGLDALPYREDVRAYETSTDEYLRHSTRYLGLVLDGTFAPDSQVFIRI